MVPDPVGTPSQTGHRDLALAHGYHSLRVRSVKDETDDTRSFTLDVPPGLSEIFRYRPGQFCTFRVHLAGDEHYRSYSMSSAPETDAHLAVTVKRVPDGLVSNWLLDNVAEGDVLETSRPAGVFCLRDNDRPVLAFCGGSGVTPVMSIAKSALASTGRLVRIVYANRDRGSVIFDSDLEQLRERYPGRLEVFRHFDCDGGFLDEATVTQRPADLFGADFYICGPAAFMDLVESTLESAGVARESIFIERFEVAEASPVANRSTPSPGTVPERVTVIIKGKKTSVAYQPGDTLLETARRGGLRPPFSCEAGNCATCMAMLHEGSAAMRVNDALTPEEVAEGWVLTCQAVPSGQVVTVEYESL